MKVEKDYEDLLKLLNKHKVKYCIIGAFAVAFIQNQVYKRYGYFSIYGSTTEAAKRTNKTEQFVSI